MFGQLCFAVYGKSIFPIFILAALTTVLLAIHATAMKQFARQLEAGGGRVPRNEAAHERRQGLLPLRHNEICIFDLEMHQLTYKSIV
jgi:hypothetical protein